MNRRMRWLLAVTAVFTLVAAACGSDDDSSSTASTAEPPVSLPGEVNDHGTETISGGSIDVEQDDFYFSPTFIKGEAGAKVTIELKNEGNVSHTFTTEDGEVDVEVAPGKTGTATVTLPQSGSLRFRCTFHESSGMQGAFVVT